MKTVKDYIISVCIILISVLLIAAIPTDAEAAIYDDTLRLHILANSDSEDDQSLKLKIRDKLLQKYSKELSESQSVKDAKERISYLTEDIKTDVEAWIAEEGYSYDAEVTLTEEWYDTRSYEGFTLPKGTYTSLRVLIGDAVGQNWWCVMYPPLCLDVATEDSPGDDGIFDLTKEESILVTSGGYSIKFKILEFISETVAYFSKKG